MMDINEMVKKANEFTVYEMWKNFPTGYKHVQLLRAFDDAYLNLSLDEQKALKFYVGKFSHVDKMGRLREVETYYMDKKTALWFSSKFNDSLRSKK
jgi:hypothetical protein